MKKFNNLDEMKKYKNNETGAYEFVENEKLIDIEINFDLVINGDIIAGNISARNITAWDIIAWNINSRIITVWNITAFDISAWNINAWDITARNIDASNIDAFSIHANSIYFYAVCFTHKNLICERITGIHEKSRYFSLEGKVFIGGKEIQERLVR